MRNVCIFRNVKEVLVKNVNTLPPPPPLLMIIRQHVQHVKNSKKSNPIPPFPQASFLKFATLPRDRKWHISKLATLPRAPYQPHAENYDIHITNQHPILPWIVRHAVYLLNRYAVHNDGQTSYQQRWGKDRKSPLCELGETVRYQLLTIRVLP